MTGCYLSFAKITRIGSREGSLYIATHPLLKSMYRFQQKLMWNLIERRLPLNQFLHLTIDDDHYDQVCKQIGLAKVLRKFFTRFRNHIKRKFDFNLIYAWRIERGTLSTERLHVHCLLNTPLSVSEVYRYVFKDKSKKRKKAWDYSRQGEPCFDPSLQVQALKDAHIQAIYAAKYSSKKKLAGITHVKFEKKTRICGTSRGFVPIEPWARMKFTDIPLPKWFAQTKPGWSFNRIKNLGIRMALPLFNYQVECAGGYLERNEEFQFFERVYQKLGALPPEMLEQAREIWKKFEQTHPDPKRKIGNKSTFFDKHPREQTCWFAGSENFTADPDCGCPHCRQQVKNERRFFMDACKNKRKNWNDTRVS